VQTDQEKRSSRARAGKAKKRRDGALKMLSLAEELKQTYGNQPVVFRIKILDTYIKSRSGKAAWTTRGAALNALHNLLSHYMEWTDSGLSFCMGDYSIPALGGTKSVIDDFTELGYFEIVEV